MLVELCKPYVLSEFCKPLAFNPAAPAKKSCTAASAFAAQLTTSCKAPVTVLIALTHTGSPNTDEKNVFAHCNAASAALLIAFHASRMA